MSTGAERQLARRLQAVALSKPLTEAKGADPDFFARIGFFGVGLTINK